MKDFPEKLVTQCMCLNVLQVTKPEILSEYLEKGGWDIINAWFECGKEKSLSSGNFLVEILKLCKQLPMTVDRLKENNTAAVVNSFTKHENCVVKYLSTQLVSKWLSIIKKIKITGARGLEEERALSRRMSRQTSIVDKTSVADARSVLKVITNPIDRICEEILKQQKFADIKRNGRAKGFKVTSVKHRISPVKIKKKISPKTFAHQQTLPAVTSLKLQIYINSLEERIIEENGKGGRVKEDGTDKAIKSIRNSPTDTTEKESYTPQKNDTKGMSCPVDNAESQNEYESKLPVEPKELTSILCRGRKRREKSVRWFDEEIFHFEMDNTDRVNTSRDQNVYGLNSIETRNEKGFKELERKTSSRVEELRKWWSEPVLIDVPPPLVEPGSQSLEKQIEIRRQCTLSEIYCSRDLSKRIPDSPYEPDGIVPPVLIPLEPWGSEPVLIDVQPPLFELGSHIEDIQIELSRLQCPLSHICSTSDIISDYPYEPDIEIVSPVVHEIIPLDWEDSDSEVDQREEQVQEDSDSDLEVDQREEQVQENINNNFKDCSQLSMAEILGSLVKLNPSQSVFLGNQNVDSVQENSDSEVGEREEPLQENVNSNFKDYSKPSMPEISDSLVKFNSSQPVSPVNQNVDPVQGNVNSNFKDYFKPSMPEILGSLVKLNSSQFVFPVNQNVDSVQEDSDLEVDQREEIVQIPVDTQPLIKDEHANKHVHSKQYQTLGPVSEPPTLGHAPPVYNSLKDIFHSDLQGKWQKPDILTKELVDDGYLLNQNIPHDEQHPGIKDPGSIELQSAYRDASQGKFSEFRRHSSKGLLGDAPSIISSQPSDIHNAGEFQSLDLSPNEKLHGKYRMNQNIPLSEQYTALKSETSGSPPSDGNFPLKRKRGPRGKVLGHPYRRSAGLLGHAPPVYNSSTDVPHLHLAEEWQKPDMPPIEQFYEGHLLNRNIPHNEQKIGMGYPGSSELQSSYRGVSRGKVSEFRRHSSKGLLGDAPPAFNSQRKRGPQRQVSEPHHFISKGLLGDAPPAFNSQHSDIHNSRQHRRHDLSPNEILHVGYYRNQIMPLSLQHPITNPVMSGPLPSGINFPSKRKRDDAPGKSSCFKKKICKHFAAGHCNYGMECTFLHPGVNDSLL